MGPPYGFAPGPPFARSITALLIAISDILLLIHSLMMLKLFFEKYGAAIFQSALGGANPSYATAWGPKLWGP